MSIMRSFGYPFLVTVAPRTCKCEAPSMELGHCKTPAKAIAIASGYWAVYLGFYGDQMNWLYISVIDTRDGQIVWRNGRPYQEETSNGKSAE